MGRLDSMYEVIQSLTEVSMKGGTKIIKDVSYHSWMILPFNVLYV